MSQQHEKRFRVAFSLAGEKKEFVSKVASILAEEFGQDAILYYKYHEAEFARHDLGVYLPELYHKQSDLVVVVVCQDYDKKEWTGLEWTAIHDLLKRRKDVEVMLCRFEGAEVTGLYSTAGFVDLDNKTPEQTAELILERLALNENRPKTYYTDKGKSSTAPAYTSIPNNLPRLQSFFGRTEELKQITEALDPDSRTWGALIDGPGGMGKTSLAVRAAYDCPPKQFERIIFLSVKDRELDDDGERQLGAFILPGFVEMLNELARELGKPDIEKSAESQRTRLILEALSPTRTLLILDNLESLTKSDRDQLFTFVKRLPQGCKAILTSRRRIGSNADVLILGHLDEAASLETLADLAKHNPLLAKTSESDRRSLYKQTGGNPLLLRWTAGQLGRGSCRTIEDALKFLRSCPPDNDPLEFVFGDLARDFTVEETHVLVALSHFSLPTRVKHIASVSQLTEAATETALRTLANRSLVVPDQEEQAFVLVPMVADFIRRKQPEIVAQTGSHLEQRAYALILENGHRNHHRFEVLNAEWPTVAPALPIFIAGANERLQSVCNALRFFLEFTLRWDEWLSLEEQGEAKAIAAGDYLSAGWRAFQAGCLYYVRGQADAVLNCATRAGEHWETAEAGSRERGTAIRLRGLGHQLSGNHSAAIVAQREALELRRRDQTESRDVVNSLNDLANAETDSGDFVAAEQHYGEALAMAIALDYSEAVAFCKLNIAGLMLMKEEWQTAETLASEGLGVAEEIGRLELVAIGHLRLAHALVRQGKNTPAVPHARSALQLFEQFNGTTEINIARKLLDECDTDG